jgi:hypothetical protein
MKPLPLGPGDVECVQCHGTGEPNNNKVDNDNVWWAPNVCSNCNGEGKLDWIENVTGKKKPVLFTANWEMGKSDLSNQYNNFQGKIFDDAAKAIATAIDKQIIESIMGKADGNKT